MSDALAALLNKATEFASSATDAGNRLVDISLQQAASSRTDARTVEKIGENAQIIDEAKQNAELATQNAKVAGANALGTNLKDSSEVITGMSADILRLMKEKAGALQTIREKQSVGLLDDPISYFFNSLTLPDDIAKHNAINEQLNEAEDNVAKLNTLTQSTSLTQSQLTESITQAGIKASSENIAARASLEASKSTRDALQYNANGITAALNVSKEVLGVQFQAQNAINAQTQIGISLAHLELSRQEFNWRKEEKKIAQAARDKDTDTDKYLLSKVNDGLTRMGMQPIPDTSSKAGAVLSLIKSGASGGNIYTEALKISQDSELAGGSTILAPSPSRAVELLSSVPGIKLAPAQEPVRELLRQATQMVAQQAATPGSQINLKNPAERTAAIDSAANQILAAQAANIKPGDASNVFQLPDLKAMIVASPPLQALPVVQKVLMPAIASGIDMNDPNRVFGTVATALKAGTITYSEALELTSVYQRGVKTNLEAKQLQSLGLNLSPKTVNDPSIFTYRTSIQADSNPTMFAGKSTVDMTNPMQVGRAMNKFLASSMTNPGGPLFKSMEAASQRFPTNPGANNIGGGVLESLFGKPPGAP